VHDVAWLAILRDVFIIIGFAVLTVLLTGIGFGLLRLYQRVRRLMVTVEAVSNTVKTSVEQISSDAREVSRTVRSSADQISTTVRSGVEQVSSNVREMSSTLRSSAEGISSDAKEMSSTLLNKGARPVGNVASFAELFNRVLRLVQQYRSRRGRNEDAG